MKKRSLIACSTLLLLSACAVVGVKVDQQQFKFGDPTLRIASGGILVVDQEPLLLEGRKSITWRLPMDGATYADFSVEINRAVKQAVRQGDAIVYRQINGKEIGEKLECGAVIEDRVICTFPAALYSKLERSVLYAYTLRFKRNGVPVELDPTVMPGN